MIGLPERASAGFVAGLGWRGPAVVGGCAPPVAYYQPPVYYGPPAVAYGYQYLPQPGYPYFQSYYRPFGPWGWDANRNWRDTWQDDGQKVHGYTFR